MKLTIQNVREAFSTGPQHLESVIAADGEKGILISRGFDLVVYLGKNKDFEEKEYGHKLTGTLMKKLNALMKDDNVREVYLDRDFDFATGLRSHANDEYEPQYECTSLVLKYDFTPVDELELSYGE